MGVTDFEKMRKCFNKFYAWYPFLKESKGRVKYLGGTLE